jgi:endonuclease/exonuclease/phosphatase family metal-dependent hydrolase
LTLPRPRSAGQAALAAFFVRRHDRFERRIPHNSILDFIFVSGRPPWTRAKCEIIVERGDFPDDETTSDHRPVLGRFYFRDAVTATTESEAATP